MNYPTSASNERIYSFHTNGHINQYASGWLVGGRGYRPDSRFLTSGAGSGWNPSVNLPLLDIDGKLLSQPTNFAEGGSDCSLALQDPIVDGFVFTNIFGGYGGGGGGCGSGGGGGGYTGGHVGGNVNRIPGGGGDAGVLILLSFPLLLMNSIIMMETDMLRLWPPTVGVMVSVWYTQRRDSLSVPAQMTLFLLEIATAATKVGLTNSCTFSSAISYINDLVSCSCIAVACPTRGSEDLSTILPSISSLYPSKLPFTAF